MLINLSSYLISNQAKLQVRWNVKGKSGTNELDHCRRIIQYGKHMETINQLTPKKARKRVSNE